MIRQRTATAARTYEGELTLNNKDKSLSLVVNGIWGPNAIRGANGKQVSNSNLGAIDPICTWKPSVRTQPDAADRVPVRVRRKVR